MPCYCPLDINGVEANNVLAALFNQCLYNNSEILSFVIGWLSLGTWVFAQFPQLRVNLLLKSGEGLAPLFILQWFGGDLFNLISCLLTGQLLTQIVLAAYWVAVDTMLLLQYLMYTRGKEKKEKKEKKAEAQLLSETSIEIDALNPVRQTDAADAAIGPSSDGTEVPDIADAPLTASQIQALREAPRLSLGDYLPVGRGSFGARNQAEVDRMVSSLTAPAPSGVAMSTQTKVTPGEKTAYTPLEVSLYVTIFLLAASWIYWVARYNTALIDFASDTIGDCVDSSAPEGSFWFNFGTVLAFLSIPLYIGGRPFQLYRNYTRKHTLGVSSGFFVLVVFGNGFQCTSLFVFSQEKDYLVSKIPYILGSGIPAIMDLFILFQIWSYREKTKELKQSQE
eukprot:gnl/Dysnectes_brevis/1801_a2063_2981.p1 GENE.gnl/Dysnectes_brevis/1801_a2063_2981~~gnl/Dysnectes_brevis/1801_a2063_2981.p1  ORF type:complete len:394 (-),score=117.60 gnl/Dysnectes_brevis/1801_a2063_2981:63-1244(-)